MASTTLTNSIQLRPIGVLRSPFTEKFGIPRQANLITSTNARIEILAPYNQEDAFKGLEEFSHIWLTFQFHANTETAWRPLIRPPRLGGNRKIGVFASRSSFRPNALGQSLVEFKGLVVDGPVISLEISCPDMLDGTPIFDIKPYVQYSDYAPDACCSYAEHAPESKLQVQMSEPIRQRVHEFEQEGYSKLGMLVEEAVAYDPRPAYKQGKADDKIYTMKLYDLDISFQIQNDCAEILALKKLA